MKKFFLFIIKKFKKKKSGNALVAVVTRELNRMGGAKE